MKKSILIVEDETQVRTLLHTVLTSEGFNVVEAEDGTRAITLLRKHKDRIRAVLTDIDMGRMNGLELAHMMNEEFPNMPLAFISALPVPPEEIQKAAPGASFLSKPFDARDVIKVVSDILG